MELMNAALAAMGRTAVYRTGPWPEIRGLLERGEVEALPLVGRTPEREDLFDFTFPYMSLHGAIVVRDDTKGIDSIDDLAGRRVAVMKGDNAEEFLRRKDRGIDIVTTPSFETAVQELSSGLHDAVVVQRLLAVRLIQESGLGNLRIIDTPIEGFRQDFCFAVREGDRKNLALLNEGLALVMADGTFRRLHAKWFAALQLPSDRPIIIGGDHRYPPFEFLDDSGRPAGFTVDMARAVAREMNMNIQIRLGPWADIIEALKSGEIDVIGGMFYSLKRNRNFDFSPPYLVSHYVSVVRRGAGDPPESFDDLDGLSLVIQEGDIISDVLSEKKPDLHPALVQSQYDVLKAVAEGQYDGSIVPRISSMHLIESQAWDNLVFGKKSLYAGDYAFAVRKGRSALLAQFGEGLKVLEENGEYRKISDRWLGVFAEKPVSLRDALAYSAMVIVPLTLVLLIVFLWSFFLKRQVAARTEELRAGEEFQRAMITCSPVAIYCVDLDGKVAAWSASAQRIFGWNKDEVVGRPLPIVPDDKREEFQHLRDYVLAGDGFSNRHLIRRRKDGSLFDASLSVAPIRDAKGLIIGIMGAVEDITDRIRAENEQARLQAQLIQARKIESVGRLAGGVAHDYNNMLGVIIGYAEMAMARLSPGDPLQDDLSEIMKAARRSSDITRQLLAFARKQTIAPRVIDLNETVEGMLRMLRRLIGEDIDLTWHPAHEPGMVNMDPTQIDQILANLCVNARDAIGGVGKLTIETNHARFDEDDCAGCPGAVPGDFVMLVVSDDGCGMAPDTLENLFEPYFTTKGMGKGTGLGLATVYGIVKQNGGFIQVNSEPGNGSTFTIYLPSHQGQKDMEPKPEKDDVPLGHGETVLIVEDEPSILKLTEAILARLGYDVITAPSPAKALEAAGAHEGRIHLMITDVVMPEMNGRDLAERLKRFHPAMRVLYMSGYTADVIAHRGVLGTGTNFIQKPFSKHDLAVKIREALK
ncbi:hypothetical protein JCM14469_24030 [Desulfatiferula olefinivorans]